MRDVEQANSERGKAELWLPEDGRKCNSRVTVYWVVWDKKKVLGVDKVDGYTTR